MEKNLKSNNIQIVEKPDWVSWEDIKQCLYEAHAENRDKGIFMAHYQWPTERLIESIGENGKMFVALDDEKLVGVAAVCDKSGNSWYAKGKFAYMGFAGILPGYTGQGIYNELVKVREDYAIQQGFKTLIFDTHQRNMVVQNKALKNDYHYVQFFRAASKDHNNVIMVKWVEGCPYSRIYCFCKFQASKIKTILKTKLLHR